MKDFLINLFGLVLVVGSICTYIVWLFQAMLP